MPELPEVEVVRRGLEQHVTGRRIVTAVFHGSRVARRHVPGAADLSARLEGREVLAARRRGKYLWLVVGHPDDDPLALTIHLGMSGQLLVVPPETATLRHTHAVVELAGDASATNASPVTQLRFVDQRTFGGMSLVGLVPDRHPVTGRPALPPLAADRATTLVPETVTHIAPDPFEAVFDRAGVIRRMKARNTGVKRALLDQTLVSGIGNIYADEALWRARVHGERRCIDLTRPALGRILDHATVVMSEALAQGGTSFDALYVNVNGASGYFDRKLRAYGRAGRPCERCGTPIRREHFMNRSSFFCPRCQRAPRSRRT